MKAAVDRLRVAVAAPLSEANCAVIERLEPRVELIRDQSLYPPMRHPADFAGDPSFRRTASQQHRYEEMLLSADALYGVPDLNPAALKRIAERNTGLRWVHTMAAGGGTQIKAADLTPDQLQRIAFTTSAGVHGAPLAEFAVFGVLAGAKDLPRLIAQQRNHDWTGRWVMRELSDLTVLVVGLGGIGQQVARRLNALGASIIGCNRSGRPVDFVDRVIPAAKIREVLYEVDAIVISLPETDATVNLIGRDVLSEVRLGTTLVNVGRGTVVDERALLDAIRSGRIGFAALDVFANEPLAAESPFWDEPGVLVSPHTAALSSREDQLIAELFAENATRLLDSRPLLNRVDTVDFY
ncbi:D-2-hydroxyacid dehydrogenase [Agromyces bracchium]|uniref:D-2-hydroxyacid dehydrogenase n=1 Tax=Agromyces bracchium TaxID=88376 RepID=A0A6I3MEH4_9MICO|nr:D-2-hydroxyacid dehydrogenase [Agromyces bracchium]MTH70407.1 D-2-hydroxyacid dehydrogenase [Agromyces bracchium]